MSPCCTGAPPPQDQLPTHSTTAVHTEDAFAIHGRVSKPELSKEPFIARALRMFWQTRWGLGSGPPATPPPP